MENCNLNKINGCEDERHWLFKIPNGPFLQILSYLDPNDFDSLKCVSKQFKNITAYAFTDMGGGKLLLNPQIWFQQMFWNVIPVCHNTTRLSLLLNDPRIAKFIDCVMYDTARSGNKTLAKILQSDLRIDPTISEHNLFQSALKNGHREIVEILIKHPKVDFTKCQKDLEKSGFKCTWVEGRITDVIVLKSDDDGSAEYDGTSSVEE
ncbi:MAG: hypothetical protein JSR58_05885 [Verrucomicrobia bacterium]|nr:hypothetical protein [Verrucomicrobiota bacterium]